MKRIAGGVAALALLLTGCGGDEQTAPSTSTAASSTIASSVAPPSEEESPSPTSESEVSSGPASESASMESSEVSATSSVATEEVDVAALCEQWCEVLEEISERDCDPATAACAAMVDEIDPVVTDINAAYELAGAAKPEDLGGALADLVAAQQKFRGEGCGDWNVLSAEEAGLCGMTVTTIGLLAGATADRLSILAN